MIVVVLAIQSTILSFNNDASIQSSCQERASYGGDEYSSQPFQLWVLPSDDWVVAAINVNVYFKKFQFSLDTWRFAAMQEDCDRLHSIDANCGGNHDTALESRKKQWIVFDRSRASFQASDEVQLDMPYFRCPEDRAYAARLSTLVDSLKSASGLLDQIDIYTVSKRLYDIFPFFKHQGS